MPGGMGLLQWMKARLLTQGLIGGKDLDIFLLEHDPECVALRVRQWHEHHSIAELDSSPEKPPRLALD